MRYCRLKSLHVNGCEHKFPKPENCYGCSWFELPQKVNEKIDEVNAYRSGKPYSYVEV